MDGLHITAHAISRYRERVEPLSEAAVVSALHSPAILKAVEIGANAVILPGGCKVILAGNSIVTIKPKPGKKRARRQREFDQ
jgi:hypothetical protein